MTLHEYVLTGGWSSRDVLSLQLSQGHIQSEIILSYLMLILCWLKAHYMPYVCRPFKQTVERLPQSLSDTGKHRCNLALRRECHARFSKRKNNHMQLYLTGISSFILPITSQGLSSSTYKLHYL